MNFACLKNKVINSALKCLLKKKFTIITDKRNEQHPYHTHTQVVNYNDIIHSINVYTIIAYCVIITNLAFPLKHLI